MKKLLLLMIAIATLSTADAQFIKRMSDRAKNKMEQKAGDKVDRGIDDTVDGKKKDKKKSDSDNDNSENNESSSSGGDNASDESSADSKDAPALKTYSKYDFIPGDKVIAYEDFSGTEIGDFPLRWNTNATAEVVTLNNKEGKWLKMSKKGVFHPEFITELPENFTLEFDLGVNDKWNSYPLAINIVKLRTPEAYTDYTHGMSWNGDYAVRLEFKPAVKSSNSDGSSKVHASKDGYGINNNVSFVNWDTRDEKFAHISIWRQKQRLRVYLNGEKIWDLPKGFDATSTFNAVVVGAHDAYNEGDFYVLNNIRLAVGAPDTRNKLITEGKFVTRGILFDVNSDAIKPESYGTIKDIANVLKENSAVRVKIIGHTDSDGDDKSNLDLSKRRAESVKKALTGEFGLEESRIETDGKGETQPVDKASTPVSKANNRRVEFIKL